MSFIYLLKENSSENTSGFHRPCFAQIMGNNQRQYTDDQRYCINNSYLPISNEDILWIVVRSVGWRSSTGFCMDHKIRARCIDGVLDVYRIREMFKHRVVVDCIRFSERATLVEVHGKCEITATLFKIKGKENIHQQGRHEYNNDVSMLETLDYTIRIGSTPTFLYFDL